MTAPASTLWGAEVVEHRRNEASEPEVVPLGVGSNMNDLVLTRCSEAAGTLKLL